MTTKKNIFKELSAINVNEHTKDKGKFTYLSWTFAWGELQKAYPGSFYEFLPPVFYSDNTCEVFVNVTVEGVTRSMFLAVMNNHNNAVKNPNARQIGDARMRCLVKCIAMFGLGLYIYAGEDIPGAEKEAENEFIDKVTSNFFRLSEDNDVLGLRQAWDELSQPERDLVWPKIPNDTKTHITELLKAA
ncbi:MAG: DUF1071 domain-containing protein [Gammaproteobacteria bacterium]|nr:DUF1071 domain-containing protein [Gammaproteobacteria bacterium]